MVSIVKRNRKLENEEDLFTHNAWDDTEWTEQMIEEAEKRIQVQREESKSSEASANKIENEVGNKWNEFYQAHGDKFFKDRRWIFSEFPEILDRLKEDSGPMRMLEVGCGVGNTLTHILGTNQNKQLHVYCCDLSQNAINTLKTRQFYLENQDKITAFQADICKDFIDKNFGIIQKESLDFITVIFTLSAIKPELMEKTIRDLSELLKNGGMIMFRDYAKYDMTQLRFKGKSYLRDDYYVRADGTTSYFFTKQHVDDLFSSAGLREHELKEDNRLLVNRLKSLKMCRRWIQAKYKK